MQEVVRNVVRVCACAVVYQPGRIYLDTDVIASSIYTFMSEPCWAITWHTIIIIAYSISDLAVYAWS